METEQKFARVVQIRFPYLKALFFQSTVVNVISRGSLKDRGWTGALVDVTSESFKKVTIIKAAVNMNLNKIWRV